MEISNMNLSEVVERLAQLEVEVRDMTEVEAVEKATAEKKELLERKAELENLEERKAQAEAINNNEVEAEVIETVKTVEERKTMTELEVRQSAEYGKAFLNALKSGDDKECRALLSTNVSDGTVPVPTFLETEIKNAWEESKIMDLVKKTSYKGNVKVGFELSATGASVHVEGTAAPEEETVLV